MELQLSCGQVAIIDDEDYGLVKDFKWHALKPRNAWYARSQKAGYLHRLLMGNPKLSVDHIDGDGLNNRRANLRLATPTQQAGNTPARKGRYSAYKGVTRHVTRKQTKDGLQTYSRWMAQISDGKTHLAAYFQDEVNAAMWYNDQAVRIFGAFARINQISEAA